jgi:hypothetical protein
MKNSGNLVSEKLKFLPNPIENLVYRKEILKKRIVCENLI